MIIQTNKINKLGWLGLQLDANPCTRQHQSAPYAHPVRSRRVVIGGNVGMGLAMKAAAFGKPTAAAPLYSG